MKTKRIHVVVAALSLVLPAGGQAVYTWCVPCPQQAACEQMAPAGNGGFGFCGSRRVDWPGTKPDDCEYYTSRPRRCLVPNIPDWKETKLEVKEDHTCNDAGSCYPNP